MSYRLEYIGETQIMKAAEIYPQDLKLVDIELKNGEQYLVELSQDGPVTVYNGRIIVDPNQTIWIIFPSLGGRIPYSPEALLKQWRML